LTQGTVWISYSRPEVDAKKLGLIGHSEGGMIAPVLAAKRKDIDLLFYSRVRVKKFPN